MSGTSELSEAARALLARRAVVPAPAGPGRRVAGSTAPLATPQLTQWMFSEVYASGTASALPRTIRLEGALDREVLARALAEIVRRHEVLRTTIEVQDDEPVQVVGEPREVELRELDTRGLPEAERPEAAAAYLRKEAQRPFDLGADLLIRASLAVLGDREFDLQVTFHHVSFDGWSIGVFLRELSALYTAFAAGKPSPLAELPIQYADYAVWERGREGTAAFEAERRFWKEEVAGSTAILDLSTDHPRTAPRGLRVASVTSRLENPLLGRLTTLAVAEGTTLFAVAFAAFQVLVGRRAGRDDFVLGAVAANRGLRAVEDLLGSFMAVLPIRVRLGGSPAFRVHLARTSDTLARGLAHQGFPFHRLVSDLRPGNAAGVDPLFQVAFNYRSMPIRLPEMDGLTASNLRSPHLSAAFDFHLNVTPHGDHLALELEYDCDLFEESTAERWLAGYVALLEGVAADPDAPLGDLPVMSAAEASLLAEEWSGVRVPAPSADPVIARFEALAAAHPDALAVEHGETMVSYGELRQRMYRMAARLHDAGATPGALVGVAADRSADTTAALLAILYLGAVYVPLDPKLPPRRVAAMLGTAGLRLILTDRPRSPALAGRPEPVITMEDALAAASPGIRPEAHPVGPDDPAYVIFTSGSTGAPKGVVIGHGAIATFSAVAARLYEVRPGDRVLLFASLSFDVSIKEFLVPLASGAAVVVRSDRMMNSPQAFAEECRRLRLTYVGLPSAFWHELVASEWPAGLDLGPSLRVLNIGGEAANPDMVRRWHTVAVPGIRLTNGYGPTETTVISTDAELKPGEVYSREVPIGRPLPGTTVKVLDERGHPVPIGVPGELYIGGTGLAAGYLGAPEATAARFVPDPTSPGRGARLYRTGDRVRWLSDGRLGYLGRTDQQIKVRGYRIEPAEIERVLCAAPGVHQAFVMARPGAGDRLVGFVVPREGMTVSGSEIRTTAARELPSYMVPGEIVVLERLPTGVTGKVDRDALVALIPAEATARATGFESAMERSVARIWERVLGVTGVGPDDNFLELGGHSLLAMRMVARIESELGIRATLRTVLLHSTVASLAEELVRLEPDQDRQTPSSGLTRVPRVSRAAPPPS